MQRAEEAVNRTEEAAEGVAGNTGGGWGEEEAA